MNNNFLRLVARLVSGQRRLRTHLVALVIITLAPTLGIAIFAVWQAAESFQQASVIRLTDSARTLARSVESDFANNATLLKTLASASSSDPLNTRQLQHWLNSAAPGLGELIISSPPYSDTSPARFPGSPPTDFLNQVMAGSRQQNGPMLSNLYFSGSDHAPKIALTIPHAEATQLLSLVLSPQRLVQLAPQTGPTATSLLIAVVDGTGRVVARSRDSERFVGKPVPDWNTLKMLGKGKTTFQANTAEGPPVIFAFENLSGTPGWVLVVGEPLVAFNARWQHPLWQIVLGGSITLLLALALAGWLTRHLLRPVHALAHDARIVVEEDAAGTATPAEAITGNLPILEFESMRISIVAAQAALRASAQQERLNAMTITRSELRYRTLAHAGALVLWRGTSGFSLTSATGWTVLTGEPEEHALGLRWLKQVHPDDRLMFQTGITSGTQQLDLEFRIAIADGTWHWVRSRGSIVQSSDDQPDEWVGVLEDVNERRQAQDRITYMALHDALTGLPNRTELRNRLEMAIRRAGRGDLGAVLYIDLDRFKEVNDTLGHPVGDALLRAVTQRLLLQAREVDVVARLGGDEFVVICNNASSQNDVANMAARIVDTVSAPYELNEHQVVIGASVGVMLISNSDDDADRLLKCADMALYRAKQEGRGRYYFFDKEMDARMQARKKTEKQLRRAIAHEEFALSYQPLVNAQLRTLNGVEAAIHWRHPTQGRMSFRDFAPLVDEIGLAAELCAWTLNQACTDLKSWPNCPKVTIGISATWIRHSGFTQMVVKALATSGLAAERLELAIDESTLLEDPQQILGALNKISALGVQIAMDNFGCSYSAVLDGLRSIPFDKVKFTQTIIRNVGLNSESDAVHRAIAKLCGSLGILTAAAGVDNESQFSPLSAEHNIVQGVLFGGFIAASEVATLSESELVSAPQPWPSDA